MHVVLGANVLAPPDWLVGDDALEVLDHGPRAGQRIIDRGEFEVQQVWVALVEVEALPDNGAAIGMERDAGGVVDARVVGAGSFEFEDIVLGVAGSIDSSSD